MGEKNLTSNPAAEQLGEERAAQEKLAGRGMTATELPDVYGYSLEADGAVAEADWLVTEGRGKYIRNKSQGVGEY